jgi:hypothetical protein
MSARSAAARAVLLSVLVSVAGCNAPLSGSPAGAGDDAPERVGVVVERRNITEVVTLSGTVEAGLTFDVPAPRAGRYEVVAGVLVVTTSSGRHEVRLPAGVPMLGLAQPRRWVPAGYPVGKASTSGFTMVAPIPAGDVARVHRFGGKAMAEVDDGPGPFACQVLAKVPLRLSRGLAVACSIPPRLELFEGMPGRVAVNTGRALAVASLPLDAVAGSRQSGAVWLETPNGRELREVGLGKTDGSYVEVTHGLAVRDRVLLPPPTPADMVAKEEGGAP